MVIIDYRSLAEPTETAQLLGTPGVRSRRSYSKQALNETEIFAGLQAKTLINTCRILIIILE